MMGENQTTNTRNKHSRTLCTHTLQSTVTPTNSNINVPQHVPNSTVMRNSESVVGHTGQITQNTGNTKLPKFTGDGKSSWKVWYARFTTVAELHRWNDTRCLIELVQHLDGSAADFVFDQIPGDCRFDL